MRSHRIGWLGLAAASASVACGTSTGPSSNPHRPIEGVEEVSEPLTDLSAQCVFTAATHTLALQLEAGDIAVLARGDDGAITINDIGCGGATAASVRRINITESSAGDQTLIIDYGGGLFATGSAGSPGITVDLGNGSANDAVKLIGTTGADNFVFGANGISVNGDSSIDITVAHVSVFVASLDDGNDNFSGGGNAATGAAFSQPLLVFGGAGNDTLRGGAGDDILNGGDGDDSFTTGPGPDGNDALNGGPGNDTADYSARLAAVQLSIDGTANDGDIATGEADNIAGDIEIIKGGAGDDLLIGSTGPDTIYGGPGSDTVSYAARSHAVTIRLDGTATSGEANEGDRIMLDVENAIGGSGDDVIVGSAGNNILDGGPGNDTISGGAGNDILRGGSGTNILNGDAGNDTFDETQSAQGADIISGGAGIDTVDYSGRQAPIVATMDGVTPSGESGEHDIIGTDVENLIGGDAGDTLIGNALDNQLEGGPGDDQLSGLAGDDVLDGGPGNDDLDCGSGDADADLDTTISSAVGCEL